MPPERQTHSVIFDERHTGSKALDAHGAASGDGPGLVRRSSIPAADGPTASFAATVRASPLCKPSSGVSGVNPSPTIGDDTGARDSECSGYRPLAAHISSDSALRDRPGPIQLYD